MVQLPGSPTRSGGDGSRTFSAGPLPPKSARMQRARGIVQLVVGDRDGVPRLDTAFQAGCGKVRFPRVVAGVEALVLNTAGGLAGGDSFRVEAAVDAHVLTVSTVACERVYRSEDGVAARVEQALHVAPGATLNHLPQPTILFDGSALTRRTRIEVAKGGRLTFCEGLVLGRAAMGETLRQATLRDRVDLACGGKVVLVDSLRLDAAALARQGPAGLDGARGIGLILHVSGPGSIIAAREALREALDGSGNVAGATIVNGVLVARILARTHDRLQDGLARAVTALTGMPVPRAWTL